MKNAEWIIKTGHTFKQLCLIQHNELANRTYTVMLCDEPIAELSDKKEPLDVFRRWLDSEHIEPILDEAEKKYLSGVIKPFRDDVKGIIKIESIYRLPDDGAEYIKICMRSDEEINLPYFRKGTMYKGMELGRKYTLEELGL